MTWICAFGPSSSWNFGSISLTLSTTSTVLAPGWRCTASTSARLPSYQLAISVFSTESMTVATSPRRTGLPLRTATMMSRKASALRSCVFAWMVRFWALPSTVPIGVLTFAAAIAVWISSMPMPRAASVFGLSWTRTAYFWLP